MTGKHGAQAALYVPVGTVVYDGNDLLADLNQPDSEIVVARGGRGAKATLTLSRP